MTDTRARFVECIPPGDYVPRVLPARWVEVEAPLMNPHTTRAWVSRSGLRVVMTLEVFDGQAGAQRWLHVSMSRKSRIPSRDDMAHVKDVFVGRERAAVEVWPPADEYCDDHPYVRHLWSRVDGAALPDFRRRQYEGDREGKLGI